MAVRPAAATSRSPRLGDYVRVRATGALGEVIGLAGQGAERYYTLNLFRPGAGAPLVLGLDDLEAPWSDRTHDADDRSWDDPTSASRGLPHPS